MKKLIIIILLLLCLTASVSQSQSFKMFGQLPSGQFADGLVFYWRGIEAVEVVDESPYGNHGTITRAMWVGDGLYYNANDNVVTVTGKPVIDQTRGTALIWHTRDGTWDDFGALLNVENTADASPHELIWYWHNVNLELRFFPNRDQSFGRYWLFGTSVAAVFPLNIPTCLAATWDTDTLAGYRNGVPFGSNVGSGPWTSSAWVNSEELYIGKTGGIDYAVRGTLSHVIIYNRALSASEIAALTLNPDLPMQQPPIWLLQPSVDGIIPIIQAHARRRRAG